MKGRVGSGESKVMSLMRNSFAFFLEWKHVSRRRAKKIVRAREFWRKRVPEDLPKDAESEFGIGGGKVRRRTRGGFFLGGSAERLFWDHWTAFQEPLERTASSKSAVRRSRSVAVASMGWADAARLGDWRES